MSDPIPDPMLDPLSNARPAHGRRPSRFAAWRPFLTGVVLGLAFLVALGSAMAHGGGTVAPDGRAHAHRVDLQ